MEFKEYQEKNLGFFYFLATVGVASFVGSVIYLTFRLIYVVGLHSKEEREEIMGREATDLLDIPWGFDLNPWEWLAMIGIYSIIFSIIFFVVFAAIRNWELYFRNIREYLLFGFRWACVIGTLWHFVTDDGFRGYRFIDFWGGLTFAIAFIGGSCMYYFMISKRFSLAAK